MYKISGTGLEIVVPDAKPNFTDKAISVIIPFDIWKQEHLAACMNATRLEFYNESRSTEKPAATYNLVNWQACEKLWDGMRVTWQIISRDRLEDMQVRLDEMKVALEKSQEELAEAKAKENLLTKAILDLAELYGNAQPVEEKKTLADAICTDGARPIFSLSSEGTSSNELYATASCGNGDASSSTTVYNPDTPYTLTSAEETIVRRRKKKTEEVETDG